MQQVLLRGNSGFLEGRDVLCESSWIHYLRWQPWRGFGASFVRVADDTLAAATAVAFRPSSLLPFGRRR
jgi:hypothetical protein